MAVREFTQNEWVTWAVGTAGLATVAQGAFTVVALAKRIGTPSETGALLSLEDGGTSRALYRYTDTDVMNYLRSSFESPGDGPSWTSAQGWCRVAWSKAAGTAAVRYHIRPQASGSWTHVNSAGTIGDDDQAADEVTTRLNLDGDLVFRGRYAVMGVWDSELGDLAIEALDAEYAAWVSASPISLWRFDQAVTTDPIDDQTGNGADQTSLTGSTVVTDDEPPDFTFDTVVTGSGTGIGLGGGVGHAIATGSRVGGGLGLGGTRGQVVTTANRIVVSSTSGGSRGRSVTTAEHDTTSLAAVGARGQVTSTSARLTTARGWAGARGVRGATASQVVTPGYRTVTPPSRRGIVVPQRLRTERVRVP